MVARRRGTERTSSRSGQGRLPSPAPYEKPHLRRSPDPDIMEAEGAAGRREASKSTERFAARDFSGLVGLEGLSEALLRNHFTLYQGYVKAANALLEELEDLRKKGQAEGAAFAGAKRRFGWEYDGIRLHELYFENLTKTPEPLDSGSRLSERLREDFGGEENWAKDFRAVAAMRGIGWAVVYHDALRNRLFNAWIDEHDGGHFAGCAPVLIMDVFEHAFMIDYGVKKADYVETFMKNIYWDVVASRLP